jgi:hypothetical protein
VEHLREQLKQETGVALSVGRLRLQMQAQGDVWHRPKPVLNGEVVASVRESVAEFLDELKKALNGSLEYCYLMEVFNHLAIAVVAHDRYIGHLPQTSLTVW